MMAVAVVLVMALVASLLTTSSLSKPSSPTKTVAGGGPSAWGVGVALVVLIATIALIGFWSRRGRIRETLSQPIFLALAGVVVFNALAYIFAHSIWAKFASHPTFFLGANLSLVLALFLFSREESALRRSAWLVMLLVVVGLINVADFSKPGWFGKTKTPEPVVRVQTESAYRQIGQDLILDIIAECESGGKHFDEEGKLIENPSTSAVGKYQIMASLHEERAKSLGFDIRTPEGNEGYARVLLAESGTQHWESDPESKACWGPKLADLVGNEQKRLILVKLPPGEWSKPVFVEAGYDFVTGIYRGGNTNRLVEYTTRDGDVFTREFPRDLGKEARIPGDIRKLRFKNLGKEEIVYRVRLTKRGS